MPRAKSNKHIDKHIAELNDAERARLVAASFYHLVHGHMVYMNIILCGIGVVTIVRCDNCKKAWNITDYECW